MPRRYVPKDPSEHKAVPKRGPKPETIELARRCEELMAQGVERQFLWERLHVTRKKVDHALRQARQHDAQPSGELPAVTAVPEKPRRPHRAVHQRPSEAGAPASWKWQDDAACKDQPLDLFFPVEGERAAERFQREQEAAKFCAACPVSTECLDYAIARPEKYGRWNMPEDERAHERRRRMRAASEGRRQQEDAA